MRAKSWVNIEIVLAFRERQYVQQRSVPAGTCIAQLMRDTQFVEQVPDFDMSGYCWAIYGRGVDSRMVLREGDRVEILRPLSIDPKLARRRRAELKSAQ